MLVPRVTRADVGGELAGGMPFVVDLTLEVMVIMEKSDVRVEAARDSD